MSEQRIGLGILQLLTSQLKDAIGNRLPEDARILRVEMESASANVINIVFEADSVREMPEFSYALQKRWSTWSEPDEDIWAELRKP